WALDPVARHLRAYEVEVIALDGCGAVPVEAPGPVERVVRGGPAALPVLEGAELVPCLRVEWLERDRVAVEPAPAGGVGLEGGLLHQCFDGERVVGVRGLRVCERGGEVIAVDGGARARELPRREPRRRE